MKHENMHAVQGRAMDPTTLSKSAMPFREHGKISGTNFELGVSAPAWFVWDSMVSSKRNLAPIFPDTSLGVDQAQHLLMSRRGTGSVDRIRRHWDFGQSSHSITPKRRAFVARSCMVLISAPDI